MRRSRKTLVFLTGLCLLAGTQAALSAAPGPYLAGLRRLTESQYRNSISDIFGPDILVQGKFEPDSRVGGLLAASSSILSITPAGFEGYAKIADGIARQVVDEKTGANACLHAEIRQRVGPRLRRPDLQKIGLQLFRRPLTADELKARLDAADAVTKQSGNFYTGIRYSLTTLLSAPDFLFAPKSLSLRARPIPSTAIAARPGSAICCGTRHRMRAVEGRPYRRAGYRCRCED